MAVFYSSDMGQNAYPWRMIVIELSLHIEHYTSYEEQMLAHVRVYHTTCLRHRGNPKCCIGTTVGEHDSRTLKGLNSRLLGIQWSMCHISVVSFGSVAYVLGQHA